MLSVQPDHFVAADGSVQMLTADDYAEAADNMLSATEIIHDETAIPDQGTATAA